MDPKSKTQSFPVPASGWRVMISRSAPRWIALSLVFSSALFAPQPRAGERPGGASPAVVSPQSPPAARLASAVGVKNGLTQKKRLFSERGQADQRQLAEKRDAEHGKYAKRSREIVIRQEEIEWLIGGRLDEALRDEKTLRRDGDRRLDRKLPETVLNFFPDAEFEVVPESLTRNRTATLTLYGRLKNDSVGSAVLVVGSSGITANIRGRRGSFVILPAPGSEKDVHIVSEIDESKLPSCGMDNPAHRALEENLAAPTSTAAGAGTDANLNAVQVPPVASGYYIPSNYSDPNYFDAVDVLVLYTPAALDWASRYKPSWLNWLSNPTPAEVINALVEMATAQANISLVNVAATARIRVVGVLPINYVEANGNMTLDRDRLMNAGDGYLDDAHALRNQYGADIVTLLNRNNDPNVGGISYFNSWPPYGAATGFNVIRVEQLVFQPPIFAHELGHNFDALHDWYVEPNSLRFIEGHGYVDPLYEWRTIMAYGRECSDNNANCPWILAYSNPNVLWPDGKPVGSTGSRPANNAGVISFMAPTLAAYRPTRQDDDSYEENDSIAQGYNLVGQENVWLHDVAGRAIAWDKDCYAVSIPAGRRHFNIEYNYAPAMGRINFALYDASGAQLGFASHISVFPYINRTGFRWSTPSLDFAGGTYLLCAEPWDIAGNDYSFRWWVEASAPAPDLVIESAPNLSRMVIRPGESLVVEALARNVGMAATSNPTTARLYRSSHVNSDNWPGGDELASSSIPALQPGESAPLTFTVTWPAAFPNVHGIGVCADQAGILESNISNNCSQGAPISQPQELGTCHYWNWNVLNSPAIPEGAPAYWAIPVIAADGAVVSDVDASVELQHTNFGDLDIRLIDPSGLEVPLYTNSCPGSGGTLSLTFDNEAAGNPGGWSCPPASNSYRPVGNLASLYGNPAMGDWRLRISDPLGGGSGNLADWTLKLCLNLFAVSPGSPNDVPVFVDTDGDGVADIFDNCTNVSNADQRDTDGDGYGNRCDADLDNSGFVNITDLGIFKSRFGTSNADADLDGNGFVNITDLGIFKSLFGKPPGPSGVAP